MQRVYNATQIDSLHITFKKNTHLHKPNCLILDEIDGVQDGDAQVNIIFH
jgi:hypothetical protein